MPGIKKKWIQESAQDDNDEAEVQDTGDPVAPVSPVPQPKPLKRPAESSTTKTLKHLGEVMLEKRKRFTPPAELKLNEWMDSNLEQRTEDTMNLSKLYTFFTDVCQGDGTADIVDQIKFNQMIKSKFGKSFGLKEGSVYKSLIKERKLNAEKKVVPGGISLKDAAYEAINSYGNPWEGVGFGKIKKFIGTHHPALQVFDRPKRLKQTLETQVYHGKLELFKGFGMLGHYKFPGGEPPQPKETKPKTEKKGDEEPDKDKEENGEVSAENGKKDDTEEQKPESDIKEEQPTKKSSKPKVIRPVKMDRIPHANPQKIEDTFPMAITFQSAPKAVGRVTIRKYIANKYGTEVTDSRWKSAIERGETNGWWENASLGGTGKLHLLADDFDPSSNKLEDMICGAIIACHEPKSAGSQAIKKYILQYHPDFKVDQFPDRFKKALIRAVEKKMIVQLSGLGASGSFELAQPFVPSPAVLAGEEDSDAESDSEYDSDEQPEYKNKGTKSRGVITSPSRIMAYSGRKAPPSNRGRGRQTTKKRKSYNESESEEEEEEEIVPKKKAKSNANNKGRGRPAKTATPVKKQKVPAKKKKTPSKKRDLSPLTDESEEDVKPKAKSKGRKRSPSPLTDEDEDQIYTPVKSKSRGGPSPKAGSSKKNMKAKMVKGGKGVKLTISASKGKGRQAKKPAAVIEDSDADDESDDAPEYTPKKSSSRGGSGVGRGSGTPSSVKRGKSKVPESKSAKGGKKKKGR